MKYILIILIFVFVGCTSESGQSCRYETDRELEREVFENCLSETGKVEKCRYAAQDLANAQVCEPLIQSPNTGGVKQ